MDKALEAILMLKKTPRNDGRCGALVVIPAAYLRTGMGWALSTGTAVTLFCGEPSISFSE